MRKLPHCDAKRLLHDGGVDFTEDFHALSRAAVDQILDAARASKYRKRKDAPGSRARMYFQFLQRLRHCYLPKR